MTKSPHVWVVEMWDANRQRWEPTVDARLTYAAAQSICRAIWQIYNPNDRFRIKKYTRVECA